MKPSKTAAGIVVIAGILQLFTALRVLLIKTFRYPGYWWIYAIIGVLWICIGICLIRFADLMRHKKSYRKATLFALLFSILGLNIVGVIGCITGLIINGIRLKQRKTFK